MGGQIVGCATVREWAKIALCGYPILRLWRSWVYSWHVAKMPAFEAQAKQKAGATLTGAKALSVREIT